MTNPTLVLFLLLSSAAYSSVGLGGGTAYLAILSFWNVDPTHLRPLAWELNIICSVVTFWNYHRRGFFSYQIAWPYLIGGVVGASLGASVSIHPLVFQILLAIALTGASVRMFFQKESPNSQQENLRQPSIVSALLVSFAIGIVSGLVGIGGGIVLGPVIIGLNWIDVKHSAAVTSAYILLCSIAALVTHEAIRPSIDLHQSIVLGSTVLIGGFLGSQYGSGKASAKLLKKLFSVVAFIAAMNIIVRLISA